MQRAEGAQAVQSEGNTQARLPATALVLKLETDDRPSFDPVIDIRCCVYRDSFHAYPSQWLHLFLLLLLYYTQESRRDFSFSF